MTASTAIDVCACPDGLFESFADAALANRLLRDALDDLRLDQLLPTAHAVTGFLDARLYGVLCDLARRRGDVRAA